ncbi:MAG: hypothetical protein HQL31_12935 [Planctomycetes bacterium]|nr:hypothetical protein [Planctomycetota bacterium]
MEKHNIRLLDSQRSRLESGVKSLAAKGAREGLVVMDDHRFVVSVTNKTVITALTAKDRDVYTNIDGVVFA